MVRETHRCRLWLSFLLLATMRVAPPAAADDNPGTTDHIKDIFIGRCYDYKQILYKSVLPPVSEDCEGLYKKFTTAFSLMPPCAVTADDYQPFMKAARQTIPKDKAMFWSGVKALAEEYASEGERYVTLEHTLIGYTVDGLVWCGQGAPPGMNFNRCPSWDDCPPEASRAFWASASKVFAQSASGKVTVMMDVSRADRPAYRRDSFFSQYELPSLDRSLVTEVLALLTHPLDNPGYENCQSGSLLLLEQDVTSRGFVFSCLDDPDAVLHMLCVERPSDKACHLAHKFMFTVLSTESDINNNINPPVINFKPDRLDDMNI